MALSVLYCSECDTILAASPGLGLTAECVGHGTHKGFVALRLPSAVVSSEDLADLTALSIKYPKSNYAELLETPAGSCP